MIGTVVLNPDQEEHIASGNTAVLNKYINQIKGNSLPGAVVDIRSHKDEFLGKGFINPNAAVPVRIITRKDEPINRDFFAQRIKQAFELRKKIINNQTNVFRLVFSEADYLPGIIVDMYARYAVVQVFSLGMEKCQQLIIDVLKDVVNPKGIYLRNDSISRIKEGLLLSKKAITGKFSLIQEVCENGVKFLADMENGHRTGFYIDRRMSRAFLKPLVKNKRVLDCFCYNGAFSVYAHVFGAESTLGLDISAHAIIQAGKNMQLNKISPSRYKYKEGNVFTELKTLNSRKEKFDVVILDPPNFAAGKNNIKGAANAYVQINAMAIDLLKSGGTLISSSSTYHFDDEKFKQLIQEAADSVKRAIRQIKWAFQSPDHPVLLRKLETAYFKCLFAEVL
ncbi:MAG: class I SAM-dependent rRNA methyltransferase [Candidatus Omnitrophica bacterium]|nr:class I SAM-dependent rRNA methyltransferase [Candidatus Omnitrophota bacterium]